jgi:hypothetical protein
VISTQLMAHVSGYWMLVLVMLLKWFTSRRMIEALCASLLKQDVPLIADFVPPVSRAFLET